MIVSLNFIIIIFFCFLMGCLGGRASSSLCRQVTKSVRCGVLRFALARVAREFAKVSTSDVVVSLFSFFASFLSFYLFLL